MTSSLLRPCPKCGADLPHIYIDLDTDSLACTACGERFAYVLFDKSDEAYRPPSFRNRGRKGKSSG